MKLKSFLKLVEIRTKIASILPFFIGISYALYSYEKINILNSVIMFFSMILLDMSVTALNNYYDYKKAIKKEGYSYEIHNPLVEQNISPKTALAIIILMIFVSAALGIYLVYLTDYIVLLLGMFCFAVGVLYSYGPIPISRTPFGEIFSGITMGFFISFITIYINIIDEKIISLYIENSMLFGSIDIESMVKIILVTIPAVLCIGNIMLANNICDIEEDIENKRYTLPVFIGRKKSVLILKVITYMSYAAILFGVIAKALPMYSLIVFFTIVFAAKNAKKFGENPTKKDTFKMIVVNCVIINVSLIISILAGVAIKMIF
ncbi:MAG: 1,4-dihydroxy-2-naphthoate polyprenyltransferase [Eubacteriales bacterium]